jgi:uncharacterized protein YdaU (DUF1376 family)
MNYYKRHIGDYAKKAGHLTPVEHGVYTLLLDAYYDRELAPTHAEAMRQARARTPEEAAAVDAVLADFFTLDGDRYTQRRVEDEFVKAEAVATLNAAKGKLGGRPRKPKGKPTESRRLTESKPSESPEKPNPLIHQSTNPPTEDQQPLSSTDDCPHAEIVKLYHDTLPANPRIKVWAGKRQSALRTRWREDAKRQRLDYWQRFFDYVSESRFLTGQVGGKDGRTFTPGLDWLVLPENFAKVIEGRYHDAGQ